LIELGLFKKDEGSPYNRFNGLPLKGETLDTKIRMF